MKDQKNNLETGETESGISDLTKIKLLLPHDVARAWQRCSWIIVNETEKTRVEVMEDMVRDFLVKHGC